MTLRRFILIFCALMTAASAPAFAADATPKVCFAPHLNALPGGFRYGFPPTIERKGLVFAGSRIPLQRRDVRERILREINYLLLDRRSRVLLWLRRSEELKPIILPILRSYHVPLEFIYLAAIESSYESRALSSAGAYGYWQFIKSTASCGPRNCDKYDWEMTINRWKDERADLQGSTHSAARYLAWMNRVMKVNLGDRGSREGFRNWLLAAAAYNGGPARVSQRLRDFNGDSYWDVPLPLETERYVPRWIAVGIISKYRTFYGVRIRKPTHREFDTVRRLRLKKDLTFATMARLLDTTPREIWELNTQIHLTKAVFPAKSGPRRIRHDIHIPKGTKREFLAKLKKHGYTR